MIGIKKTREAITVIRSKIIGISSFSSLLGLVLILIPVISLCDSDQSNPSQKLHTQLLPDRVRVTVNDKLFTEYLFRPDQKYPYFYPVNGPRSGKSVTTESSEPYPHHHSLFFGCDRVNGGNYWQEGLERGQIVSKAVRLVTAEGEWISFENECRWERPGAEAPFADRRVITVQAPTAGQRWIQFEITLTALQDIRIVKTNHSLFSARMVPELSVQSGGTLINASGDRLEKETYGKKSPWCDYYGTREGITEGLAILDHPCNPWYPSPWFTRDYGFFSPTPMQWLESDFTMKKGDSLHLNYRVIVHEGTTEQAMISQHYKTWVN